MEILIAVLLALQAGLLGTILLMMRRLTKKYFEEQLPAEVYHRVYGYMIEIDRFFYDHPNDKPFIYDKKKPLPDQFGPEHPDYQRLMSVAEMIVDLYDCIYAQLDWMPPAKRYGWLFYFKEVCFENRLIEYFLKDNGDWYPPSLVSLMRTGYHKPELDKDQLHVYTDRYERELKEPPVQRVPTH